MPPSTSTSDTSTGTSTNKKNVSKPGTIHHKGTTTRKRDVLVINAAVGVCAGRSVREIRVTRTKSNPPCTVINQ